MRISSASLLVVAFLGQLVLAGAAGAADMSRSPDAAYLAGIAAARSGDVPGAIEALREAAAAQHLAARYELARLLALPRTPYTDRAAAYALYQGIVEESRAGEPIEPYSDPRSPLVAGSHVAFAKLVKEGLSEAGIAPDRERALELLGYAADYFDDVDAQFEVAHSYVDGEAGPDSVAAGLNTLLLLAEKSGHAGAQAILAELAFKGKVIDRSPAMALALATLAVENATDEDRIWIEDTYHAVYCGTSGELRDQSAALVAKLHDTGTALLSQHTTEALPLQGPLGLADGLGLIEIEPSRTCATGEVVVWPRSSMRFGLTNEQTTLIVKDGGASATLGASGPVALKAVGLPE